MKVTYIVEGTKFKRTTERGYTHAIIAHDKSLKFNEDPKAEAVAFCGTETLAQKQKKTLENQQAKGWYNKNDVYTIVPVKLATKGNK